MNHSVKHHHYYLNISVKAANLLDWRIESKKIDSVARIELELFFCRNWNALVHTCTHTHTHTTFNGPLSRTTRVSRYQKGKSNLDFNEARDSEWQWNPLSHVQVCTSL